MNIWTGIMSDGNHLVVAAKLSLFSIDYFNAERHTSLAVPGIIFLLVGIPHGSGSRSTGKQSRIWFE